MKPRHRTGGLQIGLRLLERGASRDEAAQKLLEAWRDVVQPVGEETVSQALSRRSALPLGARARRTAVVALAALEAGRRPSDRRLIALARLLDRATRPPTSRALAGGVAALAGAALIGTGVLAYRPAQAGWRGEIFPTLEPGGDPVALRHDPVLAVDFGLGAPADGAPADRFSARWTTCLEVGAREAGVYELRLRSGDEVRLAVDGATVIRRGESGEVLTASKRLDLGEGRHLLTVALLDHYGAASVELAVARAGRSRQPVPAGRFQVPNEAGRCEGGAP